MAEASGSSTLGIETGETINTATNIMTLALKMPPRTFDRFMTGSGRFIDRLNPKPEDYYYLDGVRSCANLIRWGGGTIKTIAVLEHELHAGEQHQREFPDAPALHHLAAIMHDKTEPSLSDMLKPIKVTMPEYKRLEAQHEICLAQHHGFPYPFPATVKLVDDRLALTEAVQILPASERGHWLQKYAPLVPYDLVLPDPRFVVRLEITAAMIAALQAINVKLPDDIAQLKEGDLYEWTSFPPLVIAAYLGALKRVALQVDRECAGRVAPGVQQILDEL